MVLIGLMGCKHAGKDTVADYLVSHHGFVKYAFADPVKQICQVMFRLETRQLHDPLAKEEMDERWGMTPRQMMQKVGTDMVRNMWGDDFWVANMEARFQSSSPTHVVVSDVRFQNEADWIKKHRGILVRVKDTTSASSSTTDHHVSETEQQSIQEDVLILNHKQGLDTFHHQLEDLFRPLFSIGEQK